VKLKCLLEEHRNIYRWIQTQEKVTFQQCLEYCPLQPSHVVQSYLSELYDQKLLFAEKKKNIRREKKRKEKLMEPQYVAYYYVGGSNTNLE